VHPVGEKKKERRRSLETFGSGRAVNRKSLGERLRVKTSPARAAIFGRVKGRGVHEKRGIAPHKSLDNCWGGGGGGAESHPEGLQTRSYIAVPAHPQNQSKDVGERASIGDLKTGPAN